MSFTLAALIVLGALVVFLGLLAYHLFERLDSVEQAVYGGMRPPSTTLRREEFGRRFAAATHRAEFARRFDNAVVVFVDPDSAATKDIVDVISALARRHGWVLVPVDHDATRLVVPDDVAVVHVDRHDLTQMAIAAVPFCMVVDGGVVRDARPVGSADAMRSLLLEVT